MFFEIYAVLLRFALFGVEKIVNQSCICGEKYEVWDDGGQRWLKVYENIRNTHASLMPFVMLGPFTLSIKNSWPFI